MEEQSTIEELKVIVDNLTKEADKVRRQELVKLSFRIAIVLTVMTFMMICLTLVSNITTTSDKPTQPASLDNVLYNLYGTTPNGSGGLHGTNANYMGYDRNLGCGTTLYAPISGKVTWAGLDNYNHVDNNGKVWPQTTLVEIYGDAGSVAIQHLNIGDIYVGKTVNVGDIIGTEGSTGYSFGCHTHTTWRPNVSYGEVIPCSLGTCKMSHYVPAQGGINCAYPCDTTASGVKVQTLLDSDKTYCAAPANVPFGTLVTWNGGSCIVADRGGMIVINNDGSYWIDILQ